MLSLQSDDPHAADEMACQELISQGIYVRRSQTLEAAMPLFEDGYSFIPVVSLASGEGPPQLVGALFHVDALKIYNRALAATAAEEHS